VAAERSTQRRGRPRVHHHPAHIKLGIVAPADPFPPRPRLRQRRLDQILGQRPVTGQQHRRPLQRTLTRHNELRETSSLGVHGTSGQLVPLT
jgi:hypothetical protein